MNTTTVFAELLVGGLQTLTWMTLVALTVFGPTDLTPLAETPLLSAFVVIATCYGLGVVFDRIWDLILDKSGINPWFKRMAKSRAAAKPVGSENVFDALRRNIFGRDPTTAADFVNYNRSRMRVARSGVFNFGLITIAGLVFVAVHFGGMATRLSLFLAITGTLLTVANGLAYYHLRISYYRVLRMISSSETDEPSDAA